MEQIGKVFESFEKAEVKVLAPATKEAVNPNEEFIILATDDPNKPPHKLEMDFMREIRKADFLKEKIVELKQSFSNLEIHNLAEEEARVLQSLIKKLFKDLKTSSK